MVAPRTIPSQCPHGHDRHYHYVGTIQGALEHLGLTEMGKAGGNCLLQAPVFLSAVSTLSFVRHVCSPAWYFLSGCVLTRLTA